VLIERNGETAALRSDAGSLVFPPATAASYSAENWLLADGDEREVAKATDENVFRCDTLGSIGVVKGKTVALIRHPGALEEDCRIADIVIAPFTIGKKCRAARHRRSPHAAGRRRACPLCRGPLDQDRDGRSRAREEAVDTRPRHRHGKARRLPAMGHKRQDSAGGSPRSGGNPED
jgi:hypothetical protein